MFVASFVLASLIVGKDVIVTGQCNANFGTLNNDLELHMK